MLVRQVQSTIQEHSLLKANDYIVVAVSGGPDSVALLEILHRLKHTYTWQIVAVHVNHGLRGQEAEEDARYVEQFCQARRIRCEIRKVEVRSYIERHGGNVQDVARRLRYDTLLTVAKEIGANKIALGHHADDQAETVLMRLLRGTGASGLAGIPIRRELTDDITIVRPLWRSRRHDIELFCREENLSPRIDSSNASTDYVRNQLRLEVIPYLERYNPRLKEGLLQLSEQLQAEEHVWTEWTEQAVNRVVVTSTNHEWVVSVPRFLSLSVALQRRVILLILNYLCQGTWSHIEAVRHLFLQQSPSAKCSLPGGWEAVRDYDVVRFQRQSTNDKVNYDVKLNVPGRTYIPNEETSYIEAIVSSEMLDTSDWHVPWAVFDRLQLEGDLSVRTRRPGDRIHIKGMPGSKRVKQLFIDEKVSRHLRHMWPIVVDERDIVWIPGLRRANKALITSETQSYLYLQYYT